MPHPDNIPLPLPCRDHPCPHKPERGRHAVHFSEPLLCVQRIENSPNGPVKVTYWTPPLVRSGAEYDLIDLSRCIATWEPIKAKN